MTKKLYVGGLSYNTTEDSLREIFDEIGTISSLKIITDHATGRSKGFGFVEMSSADEGKTAITKFNGLDVDGRNITVTEAREREDNRGNGGGGGYRPR